MAIGRSACLDDLRDVFGTAGPHLATYGFVGRLSARGAQAPFTRPDGAGLAGAVDVANFPTIRALVGCTGR